MLQRYYLKILIEAEKKTRRLFWLIEENTATRAFH